LLKDSPNLFSLHSFDAYGLKEALVASMIGKDYDFRRDWVRIEALGEVGGNRWPLNGRIMWKCGIKVKLRGLGGSCVFVRSIGRDI